MGTSFQKKFRSVSLAVISAGLLSCGTEVTLGPDAGSGGGGVTDPPAETPVVFDPASLTGLLRWFQSSNLASIADGSAFPAVGLFWKDQSQSPQAMDITTSGSAPGMIASYAGAKGVRLTAQQRLRFGVSAATNPGNSTSFSVLYVVTRIAAVSGGRASILHHNDNGSQDKGLYLGWTSDTKFRLSLTGFTGADYVEATVPSFGGTPKTEIWSGFQDRTGETDRPGLTLFNDGVEVVTNALLTGPVAQAPTFAVLGSRATAGTSQTLIHEVLFYERALSASERCQVHRYLDQKFTLGLGILCE